MNNLTLTINILHLISSLEMGGAEKLLIDFLNNTNSKDVNFIIVVMNDKVNEELREELLATKHKIYFLNRKESHKHPKYIFQLLNIIKAHNINIIHSHNYGSKSWSILCKLLDPKLKLIFTVHCMGFFKSLSKFKLFLHKKFVDMNIAISKAVLEDSKSYGISKIIQIYNGIDIQKFLNNCSDFPKNNDLLNIIDVSRINHLVKGQDILIKALKECKNKGLKFKCNFVGGVCDYSKESFEYLKILVKDLDLEKEIAFLGNRLDISALLSESDLFILPSRYEGLGLVILEAMAAKVPVIASNIDGPAELITHGENGLLFKNENHSDLADQILYLYNNRKMAECLVNNAYEYVREFDISIMCKKYCELYKDLKND